MGREVPDLIEAATPRLLLRQWRSADRVPFGALNADPRVMEFFPSPLTREQSDALADRCAAHIAERGWGVWAVERKATGEFIGFVGLHVPTAPLPFAPCTEVAWRLAFDHWGHGFAEDGKDGDLVFGGNFRHERLLQGRYWQYYHFLLRNQTFIWQHYHLKNTLFGKTLEALGISCRSYCC